MTDDVSLTRHDAQSVAPLEEKLIRVYLESYAGDGLGELARPLAVDAAAVRTRSDMFVYGVHELPVTW